jgi:putative lipoprotein
MRRFVVVLAAALAAALAACAPVTPTVAPQPPAMKTLNGTLSYRLRIAIPPETEATVRLVDVSRADAPATVIAETRFKTGGRQVPLPFRLEYDPARIDPRMHYAVSGELRAGARILFLNTTRHSVLTRGAPSDNVEILLEQLPGR